jgi:hypothetical protein
MPPAKTPTAKPPYHNKFKIAIADSELPLISVQRIAIIFDGRPVAPNVLPKIITVMSRSLYVRGNNRSDPDIDIAIEKITMTV